MKAAMAGGKGKKKKWSKGKVKEKCEKKSIFSIKNNVLTPYLNDFTSIFVKFSFFYHFHKFLKIINSIFNS